MCSGTSEVLGYLLSASHKGVDVVPDAVLPFLPVNRSDPSVTRRTVFPVTWATRYDQLQGPIDFSMTASAQRLQDSRLAPTRPGSNTRCALRIPSCLKPSLWAAACDLTCFELVNH